MKKYKGLVFDLDNTLYSEKEYFQLVIEQLSSEIVSDSEKESMVRHFEDIRFCSNDILGDLLELVGSNTAKNKDAFFERYINPQIRLLPMFGGAIDFLKKAKDSELKLGLLTNGVVKAQASKIECLNLKKYFDVIVFAREKGAENEKPAFWSFNYILEQLKLNFIDTLFVGDNPHTDFKVPYKEGGTIVRMKKGPNASIDNPYEEHYSVSNFKELKEILGIAR